MTPRAPLLFSLALLLGASSCFVDDTLEGPSGVPCTNVGDCAESESPCLELTCVDGFCGTEPIPDGVGPLVNAPGDCRKRSCVSGEVVDAVDDSDRDDNNPCTVDDCEAGVAEHEVQPSGAPCFIGASEGSCNAEQDCIVTCAPGKPCPPHAPCSRWDCDLGICVPRPITGDPMSPPLLPLSQKFGDCKRWTCDDGVAEEVPDDSDVPAVHAVDCLAVSCDGGVLTVTPKIAPEVCGVNLTCDPMSRCQSCMMEADCDMDAVECRTPACNGGICTQDPAPAGTACAMPVGGVCRADGVCVDCLTDADCTEGTGTVCATMECVENKCVRVGSLNLIFCGSGFCSESYCVQCVTDAQCGDECCSNAGLCTPDACG